MAGFVEGRERRKMERRRTEEGTYRKRREET
jgi:hypothetical protein